MQDWLTYRLSDLLLFSPRTYYRMFELYHQAMWPAQLVALVAGVAIVILLWRSDERSGVGIAVLLAVGWMWVAVAFHLDRYATINWAARWFAALFVVQAALLAWYGVARGRLSFRRPAGRARWRAPVLFVVAVVVAPLAGRAAGRTWSQVELFGLTPDATAIATLALLLLAVPRASRVLLLVPIVWCAIAGATLWAMVSREAWVSIATAAAGLAAMVVSRSSRRFARR